MSSVSVSVSLLLSPELCEHMSHIDPREGVIPAAVIACAPLMSRDTMPFAVSEEEVIQRRSRELNIFNEKEVAPSWASFFSLFLLS